ncbi:hypothetical protein LINPERPRIM_LOCUS6474 [Linum perenne]
MLDKFKLGKLKSTPTPMSTSCKLDSDPTGTEVDIKQYRGILDHCCILQLVILIFHSVWVSVQGSNAHLKTVI